MTDDWLKYIYNKIVGAVLVGFSAAFDIIDHNLLLRTYVMAFQPQLLIYDMVIYLIQLKGFSLMDTSLMSNM
jgi:hypothetical protein